MINMFGILELDDNGRRLAAAVAVKVNIFWGRRGRGRGAGRNNHIKVSRAGVATGQLI